MSEKLVDVFNRSLLPAGIGTGVVKFGMKRALNELGIKKLRARVSGDGVDLEVRKKSLGDSGDSGDIAGSTLKVLRLLFNFHHVEQANAANFPPLAALLFLILDSLGRGCLFFEVR